MEIHLSVFSGLVCDGNTNAFMIAVSFFSQLFLYFTNVNLPCNQERIFSTVYNI